MLNWLLALALALAGWATYTYFEFRRKLAGVQHMSGPRHLFTSFSLFASILPSTEWNQGMLGAWIGRYSQWEKYGSDLIPLVPLFGRSVLFTRSVEVAKQVCANRSDWDKVKESVDSLGMFGESVFSSFRARWARHRKIVSPGFNNKLYEQVWNESVRTYYDMIQSEGWLNHPEGSYVVPDIMVTTSKIALYLIASCGFGMRLDWNEAVGEKIRGMTLVDCFHIASSSMIPQIFLPKWFFRLPIRALRKIYESNLVIESIMLRIIEKRRLEGPTVEQQQNAKDVFSLLLQANEAETDSKAALTNQELVSNVFLLLLAGHETTSRALGATLGLLACNPEAQEKAYAETAKATRDGSDPTFADMELFTYVEACFLEATRMFPSVTGIPRRTVENTVIKVPTKEGTGFEVPLQKDQYIMIDFIGINYNERYYPNPGTYIPERWLDPEIELGMNFSTGPRVCIGRKFALTETTATLVMLIRDWKIEPILQDGDTLLDWRIRCMDDNVAASIGFGPIGFPLRFTKREKVMRSVA